jgi:hypothetical protein
MCVQGDRLSICALLAASLCIPGLVSADERAAYGNIPLSFVEEPGGARFTARGSGYSLSIDGPDATIRLGAAMLRARLVGANGSATPAGAGVLAATTNYFVRTSRRSTPWIRHSTASTRSS